jgi:tetratricopeptide (TPR) repeat protein
VKTQFAYRVSLIAAAAAFAALAATPPSASAFSLFGKAKARKAEAAAPVLGTALEAQVRQALDERRYVDAGDLIERAKVSGDKSPLLTGLYGELLLARGRFSEALATYRSVEADPAERPAALEGEGLVLSLTGHSDEALADLKQATTLDKGLWRAWSAMGREYDLRRDWKLSQAAYVAALAAPGANTAIVLNNRGYSHLLQAQKELAAADFVAALDKDPALAAARTNLRITLAMEGQYLRAAATGVGDDRAAVLNNVGLAAAIRGDYMEADKLLNQAIEVKGAYYARAADNLQLSKDLEARTEESRITPHAADK